MRIHIIYERNGKQYDFMSFPTAKRMNKWIVNMDNITIVKVWSY